MLFGLVYSANAVRAVLLIALSASGVIGQPYAGDFTGGDGVVSFKPSFPVTGIFIAMNTVAEYVAHDLNYLITSSLCFGADGAEFFWPLRNAINYF
ncbi:hypothetical protein ETR_12298 [Erwinia tracheiphila PSU-1]|nr:hypothetical protein ETR_12298 [Erwinia tracheiphila PSU-1]